MRHTLDLEAIASIPPDELESFLKQQRWYGAKSKKLTAHEIVDFISLESETFPLAIVLIEILFDDGSQETYQLVLEMGAGEGGAIQDALNDPRACQALYETIRDHDGFAGQAGSIRIKRGRSFPKDHFPVDSIQPLSLEQSNSSVVFGDALFLKLFRSVVFGLNPDFEINLFLMKHPDFDYSPKIFAALEYERPDSSATLAFVQEYIRGTGSALEFATEAINQYLDDPSIETIDAFAPTAKQLGAILGELHLALASDDADPAFAREPVIENDMVEWWASINQRLEQLEPCFESGEPVLLQLWQEVEAAFRSLEPVTDPGMKIRNHGDYHLDQVLRTGKGWFILDFEGEPNRSLEERRRKNSPLRDIAIMMRSFGYVAHTVASERARPGTEIRDTQLRYADQWESAMRAAFLQGYYSHMNDSPLLPAKEADRQRLLNVFELDRAITELSYDINNRPDWTHIGLHSIRRILGLSDIDPAGRYHENTDIK
jgi:trehalose synthase-fused probable maltokinase